MNRAIKYFEKFAIISLTILMEIVVIASTTELIFALYLDFFIRPHDQNLLISLDQLSKVFGLFFNVLIGFELFKIVKMYLKDNAFHAELILLVGLIYCFTKSNPIRLPIYGCIEYNKYRYFNRNNNWWLLFTKKIS